MTRIDVVDGADGLTPDMLRRRPKPARRYSHCTHWTDLGERCCDCNRLFPHDEWPAGTGVPCVGEPT